MQRKEIEQKIEDGEKILEMAHEKIEVWKSIRDKVEDGQKVLYKALNNCT